MRLLRRILRRFLIVVIRHPPIVLTGDCRGVTKPSRRNMGGVLVGQFGRSACPQILKQLWPSAAACPAATRSPRTSVSYAATDAKTLAIKRPAGVLRSTPSRRLTKLTPRSCSSSNKAVRPLAVRPNRSSRQTTSRESFPERKSCSSLRAPGLVLIASDRGPNCLRLLCLRRWGSRKRALKFDERFESARRNARSQWE